MVWTPPKVFKDTNNINQAILKKYVTDNLNALFSGPKAIVTHDASTGYTWATSSTTMVVVSETDLRLSLTLDRKTDVMLWLLGTSWHSDALARVGYVDVLVNQDYWLSGINQTNDNYLAACRNLVGTHRKPINFQYVWQDVDAGTYTLDLGYRTNTATFTISSYIQFGAMEV